MILDIKNTHQSGTKNSYQRYFTEQNDNVLAVLGPTNTGKTHYAIERMLSYKTGIIGCPLRLLAREIYEKLIKIKGNLKVALITGEESIIPSMASYYVCTVEAMPKNKNVEFIAVDEIQLSTHHERGHIFTDRILNSRGSLETMFLGSYSFSSLLKLIIPNIKIKKMNRFSSLNYSGKLKISKIPRRSAVVTFSVNDVYEIAEFVKRRHGGTAVVLGALSPKTRNAQVDLYESGEVDHLVATDAIGMGLNLDINHVAFAKLKKFDGKIARNLSFSETAQIAGRAGRYKNNGTFGETANCLNFNDEMIKAIENHEFPSIHSLMWRNSNLDFSSIKNLINSLVQFSEKPYLILSSESDDEKALRHLVKRTEIHSRTLEVESIKELWDVCCIPDYQKYYDDTHFSILEEIFCYLIDYGEIPEDWINSHLEYLDNMRGELDLLGIRLSNVRMWNYISNRSNWVNKKSGTKERAKEIEDKLSDALHLGLVNRFVGYKTTRMVKKLKDNGDLIVVIREDDVFIEGHNVGRLEGFNFINEISKNSKYTKSIFKIIKIALSKEVEKRVNQIKLSPDENFSFNKEFAVCWKSIRIAVLKKGLSIYKPKIKLINTQYLSDEELVKLEDRIRSFVYKKISYIHDPILKILKVFPNGVASGLIYQLYESSGCVLISDVKSLFNNITEGERQKLNEIGVRFGEICIWVPASIRYGRPVLSWILSQIFYDINPFLPYPYKTRPNDAKNMSKEAFNAGGFIVINNSAYFVEFIEQLASHIKKSARNYNSFSLSKRNIKNIYNNFHLSNSQLVCIMKNLGYIRKSNMPNTYILENIKNYSSVLSNKKLVLSPFHILSKKIR